MNVPLTKLLVLLKEQDCNFLIQKLDIMKKAIHQIFCAKAEYELKNRSNKIGYKQFSRLRYKTDFLNRRIQEKIKIQNVYFVVN